MTASWTRPSWDRPTAVIETDPRGDLLDRAKLAVCLDIIGAAALVTHRPPARRRPDLGVDIGVRRGVPTQDVVRDARIGEHRRQGRRLLPGLGQVQLPVLDPGIQDAANLDDGDMWAVSYALLKWSALMEEKVVELVKSAISRP